MYRLHTALWLNPADYSTMALGVKNRGLAAMEEGSG